MPAPIKVKETEKVNALCTKPSLYLLSSDHSEDKMNQVPGRGECLPADINKMDEQKKSCDSAESSDTGQDIHKNDDNAGTGEVLDEDESIYTCQMNKRLKKTELSNLPTTDLEIIEEDCSSSSGLPHRIGVSSFDQQVEFEPVEPCCSESISEKRVTVQDGVSAEAVENKLLEDALDFQKTSSNSDDKVLLDQSNENTIENHDANMLIHTLPESKTKNDEVINVVSTGTDNDELPGVASSNTCCMDSPPHLDNKELLSPVSNDATVISKNSSASNKSAINPLEELHDEAKETVSDVEVHDVEFAEENIGVPRIASGDALDRDSQPVQGEQCVASNADLSLKPLDGVRGVASQVVNDSINATVTRAFAGYTGKKLLVLDVNGLLVDISSYVPYDYDPDDIIMKKAVFKRPYCDDFLKFCFERFNVGVWSSRTKRNMEPILDFLLGNDKCKLCFCWDQSHCTDTGFTTVEKRHKPLLLKKLKKLWDKCDPDLPWERGLYNESNTLLLDDTPYKALSNPQYTAVFPYTYRFTDVRDNSLGPGGDLRVYLEGLAMAENVQEYVKQNPFGQRPITEKNLSWGFYLKVIEASSTPPRETEEADS
ncbi:hypothetical protein Salat_1538200 [Sesamum alatum]|uniref:Mitochondrial import inner membrane translocase subunit TIM50 n=1 Tax=Sesamum alatum TaxID=300844 RepID=A0AAE1YCX3_9LAMI|nr:hypothetical protein Salat_1538200 [Sesamum alatum]